MLGERVAGIAEGLRRERQLGPLCAADLEAVRRKSRLERVRAPNRLTKPRPVAVGQIAVDRVERL